MTTKQIKAMAYYIIINGIFAVCLYYGFFEGVGGAKNVALAIGWFMGILSLLVLLALNIPRTRKAYARALYEQEWQPSVPYAVDVVYDLCVLFIFVWFGHYFLSVFYLLSMVATKGIREVGKEYTFETLITERNGK
jgi:hypothetical protein